MDIILRMTNILYLKKIKKKNNNNKNIDIYILINYRKNNNFLLIYENDSDNS